MRHRLSCPMTCGIFSDQGSKLYPLLLAGGFSTTVPRGKPLLVFFIVSFDIQKCQMPVKLNLNFFSLLRFMLFLSHPKILSYFSSAHFSSVTQSYPTLCDPMDCSMPHFPVHHQPLESAQTRVHQVSDAIQPSHPLSSPSPPAFNLE